MFGGRTYTVIYITPAPLLRKYTKEAVGRF
jgi:hypothetical protein